MWWVGPPTNAVRVRAYSIMAVGGKSLCSQLFSTEARFLTILTRCLVHPLVFSLYLCFSLGNAVFVLNPMNVSTCMGSTAVFSCAVNESVTVLWHINGEDSSNFGVMLTSLPRTPGPGYLSQLKVNATSQLHGAQVTCLYINSLLQVVFSTTAYLAVQGPPTNLTIIQLNATIYKMDWGLQFDVQPPFLFMYYVEVRKENGAVVYNESVSVRQLVISSLDPCDHYLATVIARCQYTSELYDISAWFIGDQPSRISNKQITDTFVFSQDNVTMRISQPGVCYFRMEAVSGSDVFLFPHLTPLLSNGDQTIAAVSLPTNKLYTINITAYNVYGHNSSTFTMSTFDIIDIICDINLKCIYNTGSFARGCLLKIINSATNNTAYCRGIERSLNTSFSTSLCSSCNGLLSTGVYIAEAYDVEGDETVSTVPAVRVNLTLPGFSTCALPGASTCTLPGPSTYSGIPIDGIIAGIVLVCILILGLIGGILVLLWYKRAHRNKKSGPPAGISGEANLAATSSGIELSLDPSGDAAPTSSEQRVHLVDTAESTPQPNRGNDSTSNTGHGTNVSSTGDAEGGVNGAAMLLTPSSQEPPARWGHVAAIHNDKLYIWGGCIKSMSENIRKDVYIFDHQSTKWTKQAIKSGSLSSYYSCAYANADADANDKSQFVYIFGGCGINVDERSNALCCLDLENMTWTECKNTGDTPGCKSGAGMVVWNGQLVLFGGYGYRRINPPLGDDVTSFSVDPEFQQIGLGWTSDLHFYDVSKETWTIQPLKTTPCAYFSFVNIGGDRILKIGGNDGVNKASNKVHILNLRQMEWSEIKTYASGLLGRDYFSTNVLRFNKKSKYAILMLGGWQSHNEVTEEVWMCTEEHNKKGTFLNCETKNLPEQKQWLKRGYHTSSTFQMSPTHIRAVVFGGCTEFPDGIKPENYPMASGTIFIDITTSRKGVNDISKWECSIHVGTQED